MHMHGNSNNQEDFAREMKGVVSRKKNFVARKGFGEQCLSIDCYEGEVPKFFAFCWGCFFSRLSFVGEEHEFLLEMLLSSSSFLGRSAQVL